MMPPLLTNPARPAPDGCVGPSHSRGLPALSHEEAICVKAGGLEELSLPGPEQVLQTEREQGVPTSKACNPTRWENTGQ